MKALFNTLLVAFALTAASFNTASADTNQPQKAAAFQSSMYTTREGKVQIAVQKETTSPVMVKLINEKGGEVFSQRMGKRQQAARFRLDVSNLPDGVYQVAISNGVETTTNAITLATKQPTTPLRLIAVN